MVSDLNMGRQDSGGVALVRRNRQPGSVCKYFIRCGNEGRGLRIGVEKGYHLDPLSETGSRESGWLWP